MGALRSLRKGGGSGGEKSSLTPPPSSPVDPSPADPPHTYHRVGDAIRRVLYLHGDSLTNTAINRDVDAIATVLQAKADHSQLSMTICVCPARDARGGIARWLGSHSGEPNFHAVVLFDHPGVEQRWDVQQFVAKGRQVQLWDGEVGFRRVGGNEGSTKA